MAHPVFLVLILFISYFLTLPGGNGSQVYGMRKEVGKIRNTLIVFISNKDEDKLVRLTKRAGAEAYQGIRRGGIGSVPPGNRT